MHQEVALFKALSDPIRLRLAVLLAVRGETCVCHLAEAIEEPDFKVSRHLSILRSARMVEARREGTWMYYRLSEAHSDLGGFLQNGLRNCFATHETVLEDLDRLGRAACKKEEECRD